MATPKSKKTLKKLIDDLLQTEGAFPPPKKEDEKEPDKPEDEEDPKDQEQPKPKEPKQGEDAEEEEKVEPPYKGPAVHPSEVEQDKENPGGLTGRVMQMLKMSHMNTGNMTMTGEPMDKVQLNPPLQQEERKFLENMIEEVEQELSSVK